MLVDSGSIAGHTCSEWHGIPANTPVGAALGDFQCSVYSCMTDKTDAGMVSSLSLIYLYTLVDHKPYDLQWCKWLFALIHFIYSVQLLDTMTLNFIQCKYQIVKDQTIKRN